MNDPNAILSTIAAYVGLVPPFITALISVAKMAHPRSQQIKGTISRVLFKITKIDHIPLNHNIWLTYKISFLIGFIAYFSFQLYISFIY